jgi:hypothetical protein
LVASAFQQSGRPMLVTVMEATLEKALEYSRHAEGCRALAVKVSSAQHRNLLLEMAEAWERLAQAQGQLARHNIDVEEEGRRQNDDHG